jgi:diguanylate cyclase (GGDEF)-like protein
VLLIVAVAAAAGIFLLDFFYLAPHIERLQLDALREQAFQVDRATQRALAAEQSRLDEAGKAAAAEGTVFDDAALDQLTALTGAEDVWLTDGTGRVQRSVDYRPDATGATGRIPDHTLTQALAKVLGSPWPPRSGLVAFGDTTVLFVRCRLDKNAKSDLWLARAVSGFLPNGVIVVAGQPLPPGVLDTDDSAHCLWWADPNDTLAVAWPARAATGDILGYYQAIVPVKQVHNQSAGARRIVLIVLSLSAGLTILVILGMHILVAGPVYRLLNRLANLQFGENAPEDLTRDLHGEPLVLARRLESAFGKLAEMSKTDEMTGLANRRQLEHVLDAFYTQARRYNRPLSLITVDIDFFKAVNDAGGHHAGDELLRFVARAIEDACRKADLPARLGGDEFSILLPETTCADAEAVAVRIRENVSGKHVKVAGLDVNVTLSIGITDLNTGEIDSPAAMQALADQALYMAKEQGRDRIISAHELDGLIWANGAGSQVDKLHTKLAGLNTQFKDLFLNAMEEVIDVFEARNPHMADHARKVQRYAVLLANELGLPDRLIKRIEVASMLHDIGMLAIPDEILLCPGRLDDAQFRIIRQHPLMSVRIMEGMEFLEQEIPAVRYHHERFDGKGYPEGIAGPAIPLSARILTVADSFDAMTSSRHWRQAMGYAAAITEIKRNAGLQFDPAVVEAMLALVERHGEDLGQAAFESFGRAEPAAASE